MLVLVLVTELRREGEGAEVVIGADGEGYFACLPSVLRARRFVVDGCLSLVALELCLD